jgi:hypothetical protein
MIDEQVVEPMRDVRVACMRHCQVKFVTRNRTDTQAVNLLRGAELILNFFS